MTMKKKILFLLITLFSFCFVISLQGEENTIEYSFKLGINTIRGTYTGEISNQVPNGEGTFTANDDSEEYLMYSGNWKEGNFSGNGVLISDTGEKYIGNFKRNELHGRVKTIYDQKYSIGYYRNGIPYGIVKYYNSEGEYEGYDHYYKGKTIKEWKNIAKNIDYEALYEDRKEHQGDPIRVEGSVIALMENDSGQTIKIADRENNIYICSYSNIGYNSYIQTITPKLKKEDKIVLYGFYRGLETAYFNENDGVFTYPMLEACWIGNSEKEYRIKENPEYTDVDKYAYYYYKQKCIIKAKVTNILILDGKTYVFIENEKGEKYVAQYNEELMMPLTKNKKIIIKGLYNGYFKKKIQNNEYEIVPRISGKEIEIE